MPAGTGQSGDYSSDIAPSPAVRGVGAYFHFHTKSIYTALTPCPRPRSCRRSHSHPGEQLRLLAVKIGLRDDTRIKQLLEVRERLLRIDHDRDRNFGATCSYC